MRGDFFNTTRAVFLRLSIAFATTTLVALFAFIVGNTGTLSDQALMTAVRAAGGCGLITVLFGLSCIFFASFAKKWGGRIPIASIVAASFMATIGLGGAIVSAMLQAFIGGFAF